MSGYTASRIRKPSYFRLAPLTRGRGKRTTKVIGFDTEADNGRPFLLQINDDGTADDTQIYQLSLFDGYACFHRLMQYIHEQCTRKDTEYIIVGWHLSYEWTQFFGHIPNQAFADIRTDSEFEFEYALRDSSHNLVANYHISVWNDKRYGATIRNLATHRTVRIIDGMRFFVTSLDKAGAMLGLGHKHRKPKRFHIGLLSDPAFLAYAKQDAYLTRRVGEAIVSLHEDYDVDTCISAPQFATRVFRHHFLDGEIALPDEPLEQAGLWSYHGGKNGYYLGRPMQVSNVYAYDITSAYPEAMRALPDPVRSYWEWSDTYAPGVHALWQISGTYRRCKYRGFLTHATGFAEAGEITNLWVTSYELDSILEHDEFNLAACSGYVMHGPTGSGPLVRYVDRFFEMKRTTTGALRQAAKLFLNSLYGKFFQKVPLHPIGWMADIVTGDESWIEPPDDAEFWYEAGGLYHPPIASLITGFVRAKIHRLEHRYDALMTSTDGFFALRPPDPSDMGDHLGGLTVEHGHLTIWRERLYAFRSRGKILKQALHGFRGNLRALLRLPLEPGVYDYRATQMMTLKMATKTHHDRRFAPGVFAILPYRLDLTADDGP